MGWAIPRSAIPVHNFDIITLCVTEQELVRAMSAFRSGLPTCPLLFCSERNDDSTGVGYPKPRGIWLRRKQVCPVSASATRFRFAAIQQTWVLFSTLDSLDLTRYSHCATVHRHASTARSYTAHMSLKAPGCGSGCCACRCGSSDECPLLEPHRVSNREGLTDGRRTIAGHRGSTGRQWPPALLTCADWLHRV
jgi:hypothetical protein